MLIGLCGGMCAGCRNPTGGLTLTGSLAGLCAGKQAVVNYLVSELQFHEISLAPNTASAKSENEITNFENIVELMNFITVRWRENFVLTNVYDEFVLDELSTRPFFILVSVDAPVHVR